MGRVAASARLEQPRPGQPRPQQSQPAQPEAERVPARPTERVPARPSGEQPRSPAAAAQAPPRVAAAQAPSRAAAAPVGSTGGVTHRSRPSHQPEAAQPAAPGAARPLRRPSGPIPEPAERVVSGRGSGQPPRREAQAPPLRPVPSVPSHGERPATGRAVPSPSAALQADMRAWSAAWRAAVLAENPEQRCATCRDFRVSDTPGRGWCANQWAFPNRKAVAADSLACLSNLGSWWVGSDQAWLAKAGTPGAPTPLADGLIQLILEARRGRRWS